MLYFCTCSNEKQIYSSLIVSGAPPCSFGPLGDGGSNGPPLASWGRELTSGAAIVIWGLPLSLAFISYSLTFIDAAALQGKPEL